MPRSSFVSRTAPRLALAGLAAGITLVALSALTPAFADCTEIGKSLEERRTIVERLSQLGQTKKLDAKSACNGFTQLVGNGNAMLKWLEANKDWCQVPDQIVDTIKKDQSRAGEMRSAACKAVAQQEEMKKKAAQGGGSGLMGGDGLTGTFKIPQGAM